MCKKQRGIPGERAKVPQQCDDTGKGLHTSIVKKKSNYRTKKQKQAPISFTASALCIV